MLFVGIDPGAGGGIAALDTAGQVQLVERMPPTDADILYVFRELRSRKPCRAILELVRASPQMGVVSAFTFGGCYRALKMGLLAADIPFDEITPRQWQGLLKCLSRGDKNVTKRRAQELFPGVKVTHAIADALLLAEFGRRQVRYVPHAHEG